MNQKELFERTASVLRASGKTKKIPQTKKVFTITDQNGSSRQFNLVEPPREIVFSDADIRMVVDALGEVIRASVRTGEQVRISGLFTLFPSYRNEYVHRDPFTGQLKVIKAKYKPRFRSHSALKEACLQYADHLQEQNLDAKAILSTDQADLYYDEFEDEEDYVEEEYDDEIVFEEIEEDDESDDEEAPSGEELTDDIDD